MSQPSSAAELQIELLGPLVVSRPDRRRLTIASRPQRRLLAVLALHVDEVVRSMNLEDWLVLSPGALRTSVSRLRRVIGADGVETTDVGYLLRADVDLVEFERLVSLAPTVGDVAARAALEKAVVLWRDDPLAEFAGERWAEPARRRLAELHAAAVEDLAVLQLDAGDVPAALVATRALVEREPFRERPRALLMRALAEGGRPTEALRAFHSYRCLVRDEVGIEPSGALVELDRAIAASITKPTTIGPRLGDPAWTRVRRYAPVTPAVHDHGPPAPLSSFVGRHHDVATVLELVRTNRLVTLTGSGGCGKTRLAIAAATAVADGRSADVRWVELGEVPAPSAVVERVSVAIGLTPHTRGDPTQQLIGHVVAGPPLLLVVDNAEHVLASVTELVTELLSHCGSLRALVTSREPLGIAGESVWRVPSLATPPADHPIEVGDLGAYDALQLFVERARDARPGLVLDHDALGHVAAICIGVDGLPLAVELAAARTRTLPIEAVAAGINDAVRWQSTGSGVPLGRHATLHASIAWSVDLVGPLARSVLVRLSVFQASFSLEAALAVGGDGESPDEVADAVGALVDASLLQFDDATGRFRMLQTVRRFCVMRAQARDDLERARARHADHMATFCSDVGAGRRGIERRQFIREMPDLVAAIDWARENDPRLVFAMCAGLASVRSALGHHANVADTWAWLLSLDRSAGDRLRPATGPADDWTGKWATAVAAQMAAATAHRIDVSVVAEEVARLLPADGDRARGWLARGRAMLPAYQGHLDPMLAHVEEARARRDDLEDSIYGGFVAYILALMGRLDESECHVAELARLTRRHRTGFRVDTVGNGYAAAIVVDLVRGDLRSAIARGDEEIPADPAFSMTAAAALAHVALVASDRSTYGRALEWSRQRTIPVLRFLPTFIELVGRRLDGDLDHAADLAEQYWEEAAPVSVSRVHPLPLLTIALADVGRTAPAQVMVEEAATLVALMDPAPLLSAGVLSSRARLATCAGSVAEAAQCLAALLEVTSADRLVLATVDALEQVAEITGDRSLAATLRMAVDGERRRRTAGRPPDESAPSSGPSVSIADAIVLAQAWLAAAAIPGALPDAQL